MEVADTNGHVVIANTGSATVSVLDDKTGRVLRCSRSGGEDHRPTGAHAGG